MDENNYLVINTNKFKNNVAYIIGSEIASLFTKIETKVLATTFEFKVLKIDTPDQRTNLDS